jgi:putative membrane protein
VAASDSLNQSMERAVEHYSSLFILPSYRKVVLLLALTCVGGGFLSTIILFPSFEGFINGMLLGVSLFFANLIIDYALSILILGRDQIYDRRRVVALSLFSWGLWFLFIFVGVAFAKLLVLPLWAIRFCLLGFSAVTILRQIVLFSTSSADDVRLFAFSILQPCSCIIPFLIFWAGIHYPITSVILFSISSLAVSLVSSLLFISILNHVGTQTLGVPSLSIFKAFLLNWIADLNVPFEGFLEKFGETQNVEASFIQFNSSKPKAVIVVPSIHPGPFKNIGSSLLPSMLKSALEKELDCVACVPHGLLGHDYDLASQIQNEKVINRIVEHAKLEGSEAKATPFIKVSEGLATACCQIFGNFAFLSFTLAPNTTEDLPQELGLFVRQEVEKYGITCCAVVNAHNSIDGTINIQDALADFRKVAASCLKKAASLKQLPFEIGAATVRPKEYNLKDGMGAGGITVVVVKVGMQKTAYVVVDGNNMVAGLREKILSSLNSVKIEEGEVFTTDTHSVSAVILSNRGYHPIGEAMNHEKLIEYIKDATSAALSNLEPAKVACNSITIPNIKVIGDKQLETLCLLIDRTLQKAKKVVIPIFALSGLLLMSILLLF